MGSLESNVLSLNDYASNKIKVYAHNADVQETMTPGYLGKDLRRNRDRSDGSTDRTVVSSERHGHQNIFKINLIAGTGTSMPC